MSSRLFGLAAAAPPVAVRARKKAKQRLVPVVELGLAARRAGTAVASPSERVTPTSVIMPFPTPVQKSAGVILSTYPKRTNTLLAWTKPP